MNWKNKYAPRHWVAALLLAWGGVHAQGVPPVSAPAIAIDDGVVREAREAFRVRDRARLLVARDALLAAEHPLAPWADYWYFTLRLMEAGPTEVDRFLTRWSDTYVADRARNDWLLELGRRGNWEVFLRIQPGFRMNDDREVTCLSWLARHRTRQPVEAPGELREQARQAWWAQRDGDFGCDAMAKGLYADGVLQAGDVWRKLRLAVEYDKPKAVQQASRLLGDAASQAISRLLAQPQAFLMPRNQGASTLAGAASDGRGTPGASAGPVPAKGKNAKATSKSKSQGKAKPNPTPIPLVLPQGMEGSLNLLAFIRWAAADPVAAAAAAADPAVRSRWQWTAEESAWAWAQVGRSAAQKLQPDASTYFERALTDQALAVGTGELPGGAAARATVGWSPETLHWMVRSGLRAATTGQPTRWRLVEQAIAAMTPEQQRDPAWQYWRARALLARAPSGAAGDATRAEARAILRGIVSPFTFYGQLAAEDLTGAPAPHPARPAPLTEDELAHAQVIPGIARSLRLFDLGWRSEAVREWNFTLGHSRPGGLHDRELLAVAELACRREIWDRCINTSDRTRQEINVDQRFPTPFRDGVLSAARDVGLDAAYMYGLIRQESRFIVTARSHVGASGLMQVMPATASWTARKLNIDYRPERITDQQTNLRIGAGYLKLVLDDFQGQQALAAAAYNAGPGRPRRWREGAKLESAVFVENIPFTETRDYVKKVLTNANVYGQILHGRPMSIKARLGATIGPRADSAPPARTDLP